jgi:hypothetical protein
MDGEDSVGALPLHSTGDVARILGVSRDAVFWALRSGGPRPKIKIAGRRMFTARELEALKKWFSHRSIRRSPRQEEGSHDV